MDFKYRDIEDKTGKGENQFHTPPFAMNPSKETYEQFTENGYHCSTWTGAKAENIFKSEYSYYDVQEAVCKHTRLSTITPTADELNAIKAIIKLVKPEDSECIYIGQLIFHSFGAKKGISIFCNYGRVGVLYDGKYIGCSLGDNYEKVFKMLAYRNGMPVKKANFPEIAKMIAAKPKQDEVHRIKGDIEAQNRTIKSYVDQIKASKAEYKASLTALDKMKEVRKTIPEEVHILLAEGERKAKLLVSQIKDKGKQCRAYSQKVRDLQEEREYIKGNAKRTEDSFKAINKYLKTGIIEKIVYEGSKGLSWVYPPMIYEPKHPDFPKEVFLGRVKTTVLEKRDANGHYIKFAPISYAETLHVGTHHFGHNRLCLGSFNNVLNRLIACGDIANLIVVARDYIQSANTLSPVHGPEWKLMNIEKPEVCDDSFEKWKAAGCPRINTTDTTKVYEAENRGR